ncbi:hypothetical protein [Streptomyces sp. XD-27]|uniref:DUF7848 domain-containing protein n=1 Tax=Streptomyces sp. XD-27 TaxID=3062779 RepID=UPI0026F47091|nr:hypothetical protein [Streptomyces sp. XD-27]WKX71915.1 hypothetical protein Q3Y56_20225 [Streptomyces sp. XD-27]
MNARTADPAGGTIVKGAEWVLSAETAEGAPRGIFGAQCLRCGDECWMDDDRRPVEAWIIDHTRSDAAHAQFRFTTERFCRVDPAPAAPAPGPTLTAAAAPAPAPAAAPVSTPGHGHRPPRARAHALPRTSRSGPARALRRALARTLARARRYAGPLLLVLLVAGSTALGALLATS